MCLGANAGPLLKEKLNVNVPVVGIKGYTFDLNAVDKPIDLPNLDHIIFIGQHDASYFTATTI